MNEMPPEELKQDILEMLDEEYSQNPAEGDYNAINNKAAAENEWGSSPSAGIQEAMCPDCFLAKRLWYKEKICPKTNKNHQ